jgi:hypothetical protein
VQINLTKAVAARPAIAFAIIANITDWPKVVDSIRSVELLTPGPVRPGTKFLEDRVIFGRESVQQMEVITLERPHRLRLFVEHPDLHYELDHLVDAVYGGGCRIMLIFRSRPKGARGEALYPFMKPFEEISLRDELERDLSDLASAVSSQTAAVDEQ